MEDTLVPDMVRRSLVPLRDKASRAQHGGTSAEVQARLAAVEASQPLSQLAWDGVNNFLDRGVEAGAWAHAVRDSADALEECLMTFAAIKEAAIAARPDTSSLAAGVATLTQVEGHARGMLRELKAMLEGLHRPE